MMRFELGYTKTIPYEPADDQEVNSLLDSLGPYAPPKDYSFEPELCPPVPRPIPEVFRGGHHAHRQRTMVVELTLLAVACLLASRFAFVRYLGGFFLPLLYLDWIGLSIALLVVAILVYRQFSPGPFRYVERGEPIVGRVCSEEFRPHLVSAADHTVLNYQFAALVQYRDPQSEELVVREMTSLDIKLDDKDLVASSFRVGDYVTLVYLPNDPRTTMRLYGYLGLRNDLGVVMPQSRHGWEYYVVLNGALAFVAFLAWTVYTWQRYWPINPSWQLLVPIVLGVIGFGSLFLAAISFERRWEKKVRGSRNANARVSGAAAELEVELWPAWEQRLRSWWGVLLIIVLGGAAGLACAVYANARFDTSAVRKEPIVIGDLIINSRAIVFRSGTIKYGFSERGDGVYHSYFVSPEELNLFRRGNQATAHVRDGRFGWQWIERLDPQRMEEPAADGDE
jgi:hypothetical protein